eukprot:TRINITY_DN38276_c0_g1_i1.p1 TRINITY_DN38276_c0_g1~~TRINITY_DN38276_c0_g1_i1.p1  ORF type:complete len:161 (+),score=42.15 TRINITY_DN38276_c0_g1_i1:69-485(+)
MMMQVIYRDPLTPRALYAPFAFTWYIFSTYHIMVFSIVFNILSTAGTGLLFWTQFTQIGRGITTNEAFNLRKYDYMRTPDGVHKNPFNRGFKNNFIDFMGWGDASKVDWSRILTVQDYVDKMLDIRAASRGEGAEHVL